MNNLEKKQFGNMEEEGKKVEDGIEVKEKLIENSEEFVDRNEPIVNKYINELLKTKDIDQFNNLKKIIKSERNFEDLLDTFRKNKKFEEVYQHFSDLKIDELLDTKTEEEFREILDKLSERDDFDKIHNIARKTKKFKEVNNHLEKLAQVNLGLLVEKCKKVSEFEDLNLNTDNLVRARGMFFEVLVPENYGFVIKRLYRNEGMDKNFNESKEYCEKANKLNREFYHDFLPEEEIIKTSDGQLFVKAEKVDDDKKEYLDLDLVKEEKQEYLDNLLKDNKFASDLKKFLDASEKFYESTKEGDKEGFLPDIAGKNLKIIYDSDGKYKKMVYIDTMGYLDREHCKGSYGMAKELLKKLSKRAEIIDVRKNIGKK